MSECAAVVEDAGRLVAAVLGCAADVAVSTKPLQAGGESGAGVSRARRSVANASEEQPSSCVGVRGEVRPRGNVLGVLSSRLACPSSDSSDRDDASSGVLTLLPIVAASICGSHALTAPSVDRGGSSRTRLRGAGSRSGGTSGRCARRRTVLAGAAV